MLSPLKDQLYPNSPPIFFNSSTDTLWLTTIMDNVSQNASSDDLGFLDSMNDILGDRLQIKKIALPAEYWCQEINCDDCGGAYPDSSYPIMDSLTSLQVEEVILIVENNFVHQYGNDIAFVELDRGDPYSVLNDITYFEGWNDIMQVWSWDDAEVAEMKRLRNSDDTRGR